jgi:uracil phosphoribosyltransferase
MTNKVSKILVVDHPLVQHKLSLMRKRDTDMVQFRALMREISLLLGYEATRGMTLTNQTIETPLATMEAPILESKKMALVSILRAGNGILDGMLEILPTAHVGHIGLSRNPKTFEPIDYYCNLPSDLGERHVLVLDPMLATGHSAVAGINMVKKAKPRSIAFVCILAAPEGIRTLQESHPDVSIITAAIDDKLNEKAYIIPGLGDAGDRLFGTI